MCTYCICISLSKECIDQFPVFQANQITKLWNPAVCSLQKDSFRFCCRLYGKRLSFQITQGIDVTVLIDCNHLVTDHIRTGPFIIIQSSFHGEAAHNTINITVLYQLLLPLPVNIDNFYVITHSSKCFRCQFNIDSRWYPIFIQIIIRGITVASKLYNRAIRCVRSLICFSTSGKPCRQTCQHKTCAYHSLYLHLAFFSFLLE